MKSPPRWDGDDLGAGIADGTAFAPDVRRSLDALAQPAWVAERPEDHLLPRLAERCADAGSSWTLNGARLSDDGVYLVDLTWAGAGNAAALRADAFALIGCVAESATHVRQIVTGSAIDYRIVTGMLDGDSPFAAHGHLLTLRITGPRVVAIITGMQRRNPAYSS